MDVYETSPSGETLEVQSIIPIEMKERILHRRSWGSKPKWPNYKENHNSAGTYTIGAQTQSIKETKSTIVF